MEEQGIDAIFDVLADDHRRALLAHLQEVNVTTVEELASFADQQADGYRGDDQPADPAIRLHHVHLPKLADADLVTYDRSSGRVEYVGDSRIADLLATAPRETVVE